MAKNLYEILGVEKTADAMTIKRAYYTLVKKYPPEKCPAEFQELRSAYETLFDPAKRAEYDGAAELPKDAADLLAQAKELIRRGGLAQAVDVYEKLLELYPDLLLAQVGLAQSYEAQDKKGKAVKLWESICSKEPGNAEYALELALGYEFRGWNNKARAQYQRALELDDGNVPCWLAWFRFNMHEHRSPDDMAKLAEQAVAAVRAHGRESFSIYCYQAVYIMHQEGDAPEVPLRHMLNLLKRGQVDRREDPDEAIAMLLDRAITINAVHLLELLIQMAECIAVPSDDLREALDLASKTLQIEALTDEGYHAIFYDLFSILMEDGDSEDSKDDLMAMECHILYDAKIFNPQIQRLKAEKPLLYAIYADFFGEVLRTREPQKLMYARIKALSKKGIAPSFIRTEEDAPVETVRREGLKIGRNDPCPCGSGKKYKKCCGR